MEKQRNIKILTVIALIFSVLCLSVAFTTISTTIKIKNEIIDEDTDNIPIVPGDDKHITTKPTENAEKQESVWSVRFKNLGEPILTGTTKVEKDFVSKNNTTVLDGLDVTFSNPKDSITYTFDVVNDGNIDAKISNLVKLNPVCNSIVNNKEDEKYVCDNINYILTYTDSKKEVKVNDILNAKSKKNLTLKIEYNANNLPVNTVKISELSIIIIYVQK